MTLWQRDWFLSLDGKYQLFVHYLRDHCDHAGVWQPAFKLFEKISGFRIDGNEFLTAVNSDSIRILVLENGKWWITGFIEDQYKTKDLTDTINPHKGIINSLHFNKVPYKSYGYKITLRKGFGRVKDQDQDQDQDKDQDKDHVVIQDIYNKYNTEGGVGETELPTTTKQNNQQLEINELSATNGTFGGHSGDIYASASSSVSASVSVPEGGVGETTWRDSFDVYQKSCREAYQAHIADQNWLAERQKYHPRLNIKMTLEKACRDYWSTEAAWEHKRRKRGKAIDWRRTFNNALAQKINQVWLTDTEPRKQQTSHTPIEELYK